MMSFKRCEIYPLESALNPHRPRYIHGSMRRRGGAKKVKRLRYCDQETQHTVTRRRGEKRVKGEKHTKNSQQWELVVQRTQASTQLPSQDISTIYIWDIAWNLRWKKSFRWAENIFHSVSLHSSIVSQSFSLVVVSWKHKIFKQISQGLL